MTQVSIPQSQTQVKWLTDIEVANLTGLSVFTLRAHRQKGIGIPYYKIGRSVRYKLDDVEAFMDAHKIRHLGR